MITWWKSLTQREQILIVLASALTFLFLIFQFVVRPSWDSKDRAERAYANALSEWNAVQRVVGTGTSTQNFSTSELPLQTVVTNSADSYSLSLTRLLPDESGNLSVWLDGVNSNSLYSWLKELETSHGIRVRQATIRQDVEGETVSLNVYLTRNF